MPSVDVVAPRGDAGISSDEKINGVTI